LQQNRRKNEIREGIMAVFVRKKILKKIYKNGPKSHKKPLTIYGNFMFGGSGHA